MLLILLKLHRKISSLYLIYFYRANQKPVNYTQMPTNYTQPPEGFSSHIPTGKSQAPEGFSSHMPTGKPQAPEGFLEHMPTGKPQPPEGYLSHMPSDQRVDKENVQPGSIGNQYCDVFTDEKQPQGKMLPTYYNSIEGGLKQLLDNKKKGLFEKAPKDDKSFENFNKPQDVMNQLKGQGTKTTGELEDEKEEE